MSWTVRRVSELAELINGYPFDASTFSGEEGFPLVRIRDLLATEYETFVPSETVPPAAVISDGDVVIGMDGDFNCTLWRRGEAALNQRMCLLRGNGSADMRFLAYALPDHLKTINDLTYSTTVKHLSSGQVRAIRLAVPPAPEQRAIADFLDRETGQIDRLIEKQEQLIDTLRERRAAVADHAVTRGLDPLVALKATDLPWPGDIPAHWTISRFGIEMAVNNGQVDPRQEPWADAVLVAPNHIESGTGRIVGRETARQQGADSGKYVVSAGQIIYSKIRPALNKVAIATEDCICSADMYAISSRGQSDMRYAAYYMRSTPFHQYASLTSDRVKMPKINRSEVSGAPWLVPPIDEQRAIADYLDDQTAKIDALIGKAEGFIGLARERRAALVSAAATGRIDVRGAV